MQNTLSDFLVGYLSCWNIRYQIWHCMWDINHGLAQALIGYHHRVTMLSCHHMSSYHTVIVSYCHCVIMLSCHRIIVLSCHHVTILDLALHAWYQSLVSTSFDWSASNVPILLSLSYCHNLVIGISLQLHPILIPFRIT